MIRFKIIFVSIKLYAKKESAQNYVAMINK